MNATAWGHPVQQPGPREIIRIQGYRTNKPPAGTKRRLELRALGSPQPFATTDWQVFAITDTAPPEPDGIVAGVQRFALQGSREDVARFAAARSEQRVTLLAERRPGSSDLYILALDLCPPQ